MKRSVLLFIFISCIIPRLIIAVPGDIIESIIAPGTCPTGLAWDGDGLWVADRKTDTLYKINPISGDVEESIPSPGFWPMGLTWDGEFLWNVDLEEEAIYKIDPKSKQIILSISTPCPSPRGLAWDRTSLWVCDDRLDMVYNISAEDGTIISSFASPSSNPTGLTYDGKYLWIADRIKDEIYMVTPNKGDVIVVLDSVAPYIQGLTWDGQYLWAVDYQTDKIYKMKIIDDDYYSIKDEHNTIMEYTQEFRNYGPDVVNKLDFYLAVPQDLNNQKIISDIEYNPEPSGFLTDQWGQTVAHYTFTDIPAPEIIRASMKVKAKIFKIHYYIFPEKVGGLNEIPGEIKDKYLVDGTKYLINNPIIKEAVKQAVGNEKNPYWIARKIFKYIIDHIKYELARGWDVAPAVLERGTGSCSEYTFVFIAMCRAAGLPARYAGAVGIRGDNASLDLVFHRWAEVYLPNYGWIPVDPARGDSESPRNRALAFGALSGKHLITTLGGGGSKYLAWRYNSAAEWTFKGKVKVHLENIAEWEPLEEE
ncbi:transglutaminase [candidate division WOR-3 bacterium]|nr:transglutaminase [candidate division WOR-3 bacterium]